jgi:hypothetical protein
MDKTGAVESSVAYDREMEGDALVSEKEGTVNDVMDMRRMGKHQSLRVRHFLITFPTCRTDRHRSAKLWIPLHLRVCHDSHEYVGDAFRVRRSKCNSARHWILTTAFRLQNVRFRSRKRRHGGPGLRLHWNAGWLFAGHRLHGRDGFHVRTRPYHQAHCWKKELPSTNASFHRAPTAGGQYHWVSEVTSSPTPALLQPVLTKEQFAPPRAQKFLSYLIGTVSSISLFATSI